MGITEVGAREEEGALAGTMKKKTGLEPPLLLQKKKRQARRLWSERTKRFEGVAPPEWREHWEKGGFSGGKERD